VTKLETTKVFSGKLHRSVGTNGQRQQWAGRVCRHSEHHKYPTPTEQVINFDQKGSFVTGEEDYPDI
jgi:hypothetical protein